MKQFGGPRNFRRYRPIAALQKTVENSENMQPQEFIDNVVASIESLVSLYAQGKNGPTYIGSELDKIGLTADQRAQVLGLIRLAVGEATHSIICGIEGTASLGNNQQMYRLLDAGGNELTGQLDALLYERLEE